MNDVQRSTIKSKKRKRKKKEKEEDDIDCARGSIHSRNNPNSEEQYFQILLSH